MKEVHYDIKIDPSELDVELLHDKACKVTFKSTHLNHTFKLPTYIGACVSLVNVSDSSCLRLSTLKKWVHRVKPIHHTWSNMIRKYALGRTYYYEVQPVYKHFPIVLSVQGDVVSVYNYLGLKKYFYIKFDQVKKLHVFNKKLYIESHNDVLTGSNIDKLKAIRYKTHHKKLDRRIFCDGFNVKKSIDPFL